MKIAIVTPVYRALQPQEWQSLKHNSLQLQDYDQYLLTPAGMSVADVMESLPRLQHKEVTSEWLGSENGLLGYNRMMIAAAFYEQFADYDYILICHVDAWIFKGKELAAWADKGYDCMAAPWMVKHLWLYRLKYCFLPKGKYYIHYRLHGKVGNGGLSLRHVSRFRQLCVERKDELEYAVNRQFLPEDVVWAIQDDVLRCPPVEEALGFAFDTKPAVCYKKNGYQLPFGCHAWFKDKYAAFWHDKIEKIR